MIRTSRARARCLSIFLLAVICGVVYTASFQFITIALYLGALGVCLSLCLQEPEWRSTFQFSGFMVIWHAIVLWQVFSPLAESLNFAAFGIVCLLLVCSIWQTIPFSVAWVAYRAAKLDGCWYGPIIGGALLAATRSIWPSPFPGAFFHPLTLVPELNSPLYTFGASGFEWLMNTAMLAFASFGLKRGKSRTAITIFSIITVFIVSAAIREIYRSNHRAHSINALIVQDGLVHPNTGIDGLLDEVDKLLIQRPSTQLVAFPETGIFIDGYDDENAMRHRMDKLYAIAKNRNVFLLFMSYPLANDGSRRASSVLLSPDGRLSWRDKQILLPFGEYLPKWGGYFDFFGTSQERRKWASFAPGERDDIFMVSGLRFQVFVCYESVFPDFMGKHLPEGSDLVIVQSNLNDFLSNSKVLMLHMMLEAPLPVSYGIPVLRVVRGGGSAVVDSRGEISRYPLEQSHTSPYLFVSVPAGAIKFPAQKTLFMVVNLLMVLIALAGYMRLCYLCLFIKATRN